MNKPITFLKALICLIVSFTAPFVMLIAMWTVSKNSKKLPSIFGIYRTPDEKDIVGFYEPAVQSLWDKCWRCAVWNWYGWRNRAHGMQSMLSYPCFVWPEDRMGTVEFGAGLWIQQKQLTKHIRFIFGWGVYHDKEGNPVEARPVLSLKWRTL